MQDRMFLRWPSKNCHSLTGKFWVIYHIHQTLHIWLSIYLSLYKILLMEKNFNPLEDCKRHLEECFVQKDKKFGKDRIMKLLGKWQKIVEQNGEYIVQQSSWWKQENKK